MILKILFLIILAIAVSLFQTTVSGKISILGIRPNLILILLLLIIPIATKIKEKERGLRSSLFIPETLIAKIDTDWQIFFLLVAIIGFIFDALNIDRPNGFYFASFSVIGILIYLLFQKLPFKNIFFQLIIMSFATTIMFNLIIGQKISYLLSQKHLIELFYNTLLVILIFGIMNIKKFLKNIRP